MNILFITAHKYLPQMRGGIQVSTNELCHALLKRGHRVSVLAGLMDGDLFGFRARIHLKINQKLNNARFAKYSKLGYSVYLTWFPWELVSDITDIENPDIIIVLTHFAVRMASAAASVHRPFLLQLQDVEFHQLGGTLESLGPHLACVANSHFTAKKYKDAFNVDPEVIYPFVDQNKYRTPTLRKNVTFINPHTKKGLEIAKVPPSSVRKYPLYLWNRGLLKPMSFER